MIRFERVGEPSSWKERGHDRGMAWLAANPGASRPYPYWNEFRRILADGFHQLCGYTAMYEPVGTVDHFQSWKDHPELAYEWSNFRFAAGWVNSAKKQAVLDPFEVEDDWFEVSLPDMQLGLTQRVPAAIRPLAQSTIKHLGLRDDERVIRQRRRWYRLFKEGNMNLDGLRENAPLIARAVEKHIAAKMPLP